MEGQNLFRRALSAAPALESDAPNPSGPPALKPRRTSLGRPQSKWKRSTVPVSDDELESMLEDDPADALEFESLVRRVFVAFPAASSCALLLPCASCVF